MTVPTAGMRPNYSRRVAVGPIDVYQVERVFFLSNPCEQGRFPPDVA